MKRFRWLALAAVLASTALAVWLIWFRPPVPEIDPKTVAAYKQRGGTYGWMVGIEDSFDHSQRYLKFYPPVEGRIPSSNVPAFRFERFDNVRVDELPPLGRAMGLDLSRTQVTDDAMAQVAKLDHLTHLSLAGTNVTDAGLKNLTSQTGLTHLDLRGTKVTDAGLVHLAALINLTHLYLKDTQVTGNDVAFLTHLNQLTHLYLTDGQVTDELLGALVTNQKLHVLRGPSWEDAGGPPAAADSRIINLSLSRTQVTDAGLKLIVVLPNLRRLFLSGTKVTDAGMKHLAALTSLRRLELSHTAVTDAGMGTLADHPSLDNLTLTETKVTDAGVKRLISSKSLGILYLSDAQITDEMLAVLVAHAKLHLLPQAEGKLVQPAVNIGATHKQEGPYRLGTATDADIRLLRLSNTRVTNAGLEHLAGLTDLEQLDLTGTAVTEAGRKRIQERFPKCRVLP